MALFNEASSRRKKPGEKGFFVYLTPCSLFDDIDIAPEMNTAHFFDSIFRTAKKDGMLILNRRGEVQRVNTAFTFAFGYTQGDLEGMHIRMLFTEADQLHARPEEELLLARRDGSASDDAYVMHKDGTALWATGEVYHVRSNELEPEYYIKLVHNISALKLLDKFVFESGELVNTVFHSLKEIPLVVIDTRMNVLRSNEPFRGLFGQPQGEEDGPHRLSHLGHPIWKSEVLRQRMRELIVLGKPLTDEEFGIQDATGREQALIIRSKTMEADSDGSRQFLLMIREKNGSRTG